MTTAPLAVVTGATSGIGYETCRVLARQGWRLYCVGRDAQRGAGALQRFRADGAPEAEFFTCDLALVADTARLGEQISARGSPLDLLLNNAGSVFYERETTGEGFERTFALNHLAYFVLTNKLLPLLQKSASARIVSVASAAHYGGKLDFGDLQLARNYSGWRQYQNSKLMNVLFTRELARRLSGAIVTANCLHPGFVASRFGSNNAWWWKLLFRSAQLMAISPQKSARAVAWLATSPTLAGTSGAYFDLQRPATPSRAALDDGSAQRLWQISEQLVSSLNAR